MKYAIIETNGKQYQAMEGKTLTINAPLGEKDQSVKFDRILLFSDGEKAIIGHPFVNDIVVEGKIIKTGKGKKVHVHKFKAKVRYRRHMGFRPARTDILIERIKTSKKKEDQKENETRPRGHRQKTA